MLLDTPVWVEYFQRGNGKLARHPFELLGYLPSVATVTDEEALLLLEQRDFAGLRVDWIDMHALASARLDHAALWTRDQALAAVGIALGIETVGG